MTKPLRVLQSSSLEPKTHTSQNKKAEPPCQATRLSRKAQRPVAFRHHLAVGLALLTLLSQAIVFCENLFLLTLLTVSRFLVNHYFITA
jgi:hypothetical protein